MRIKLQNKITNTIIDSYNTDRETQPILFLEIKTGTGKTKILLDSAVEILKKTNKSVIISTPNNFLSLEYLRESEKFNIQKDNIEIIVGKKNYLNTNLVLQPKILEKFNLDKTKVENWINENQNFLLTVLFLEHFSLESLELKEDLIDLLSDDDDETTINDIADAIIQTPRIYITNHYYLIYLLKYANNSSFFNLNIFVDEVHLLNDVAKSIYKESFSPFRLNFLLNTLKTDDEVAKIDKQLISQANLAISLFVKNIQSEINTIDTKKYLNDFVDSDTFKELEEMSLKLSKKNKINKSLIFKIRKEVYEAKNIAKGVKDISTSFSQVRLTPSFAIAHENIEFKLRELFVKHSGLFVGISGTICINANDNSINANKWTVERLGFFNTNKDNEKNKIRTEDLKLQVYDSIFDKKQVRFYIEKDIKFTPIHNNAVEYENWVKNLATLAKETLWNNGLILMSSYENIELMEKHLILNNFSDKYKIFAHKEGVSMRKVVDDYKQSVADGNLSVLIGGLGFFTGLDLSGKLFSNITLFIGKLPLEPRHDYFKKNVFKKTSNQFDMNKKALLTFRQGIGRAIRDKDDKAFIVVADARINKDTYSEFKLFLEKIGIEI